MVAAYENDSIWLFDVLEIIGVNDFFRKTCQRACIMKDILDTFQNEVTIYYFRNKCERAITSGNDLYMTSL